MYYTPKERIDIGRKVFQNEISKENAAKEYEVSVQSIINYVKEYMKEQGIPVVPEAKDIIDINTPNYSEMSKEELIKEIMKKDIEVARAKKGYIVKGGWKDQGIQFYKRCEYQIAMELSSRWPLTALCKEMSISRSGFYKWRNRIHNPCKSVKKRMNDIVLFEKYHSKYPSHGYRWLNAKIRLDLGLVMSDQYAHRCCKFAGIKSESKHYRYKAPGEKRKVYENMVLSSMKIDGPLQVVVSDMTAFWANKIYWELTRFYQIMRLTTIQQLNL